MEKINKKRIVKSSTKFSITNKLLKSINEKIKKWNTRKNIFANANIFLIAFSMEKVKYDKNLNLDPKSLKIKNLDSKTVLMQVAIK